MLPPLRCVSTLMFESRLFLDSLATLNPQNSTEDKDIIISSWPRIHSSNKEQLALLCVCHPPQPHYILKKEMTNSGPSG